jgi:hypothetical protein
VCTVGGTKCNVMEWFHTSEKEWNGTVPQNEIFPQYAK